MLEGSNTLTPKIPDGLITRRTCRVCGSKDLKLVLSLGNQYISSFVDSPTQESYIAPLELVLCDKRTGGCGLLQLRHTVPGEVLYRKYWYKSGVNQTMRTALADIAHKAEKLAKLSSRDIVLDIGCNDGTLLRSYKSGNLALVGFEPATNLIEDAQIGATKILNDFFNYRNFEKEFGSENAKIITAIAMFYDLEEPNQFVNDIVKTLDKDGIWIIQMNYLPSMLQNNAFDNIVHEHLEYYSLQSMEYLLDMHDLKVFDVELNDVNGGSFRSYVKHKDCRKYPISRNVINLREYEKRMRLNDYRTYDAFAKRISNLRAKTYDFIKKEVEKGKKVYVYGASTKGNTILQFYNLDNKLIKAAAERNPEKWGKKTIGTMIPIISEEQARRERADYFLILPWHFIKEFKEREKDYLNAGGKFIVPLPKFEIIGSSKKE
ncbi:MAG: class I SAM-dependent methyltransferase [Candidatus Aminicenantes bacterium]|nr:class I SAM-dependent methyltransferase [Candidatus Aminicenantes bacterium]